MATTHLIGYSWTDLNTLAGVPVGKEMLIQNVGVPADVIIAIESETEPTNEYDGVFMKQLYPMYKVETGSGRVWVKLYRYDLQDQSKNRTAAIRVQS